jgi:hypothetical protein
MTPDTVVAFGIPLVALLISSPMMWLEENLWNLKVLQRVHLSNLVYRHPIHIFAIYNNESNNNRPSEIQCLLGIFVSALP